MFHCDIITFFTLVGYNHSKLKTQLLLVFLRQNVIHADLKPENILIQGGMYVS